MTTNTALQRFAPAFVVLATIAVYLNSLGGGFAFDDLEIIQANGRVHDLTAWRDIWFTPYWPVYGKEYGLYRPFIIFLYALQWAIGGGAAWVFHAGNVLLHALATLLVFLLLDRLTGRMPAAIGATLFAVHPVHTEAVANVVGQAEVVTAIALFAAALVHISRPAGVHVSWPRRLALIALFGLGVATKEHAVVLPGLLVALDFAQRRVELSVRGLAAYADAMLMPLLLIAATLALYLVVRFDVLGGTLLGVNAAPALPYLREEHRVLNALRAFPEFLRLLVFPLDLAVDYGPGVLLPVESLTPMTVLGALLLVTVTALALATPWLSAVGMPAAWFLISIITVSNLFFPIGVLVAERTLYAPSFAISLALALAWRHGGLDASRTMRCLAPGLVAVALALMAFRTVVRNRDWVNNEVIAARFASDHPESYRVHWFEGWLAWNRGQFHDAEFRFRVAHRLYARDPQMLLEYGIFLIERGRAEEAVPLLETSYALRPFTRATAVALAGAYIRTARWHDALARIADADALEVDRTVSMPLRALAHAGLGQHDLAVAAWRVAHRYAATDSWIPASFLARALAVGGYRDDARAAALHARQSTTQPGERLLLDRLLTAIDSGCYETRAAPVAPQSYPACDPLGDFFSFGARRPRAAPVTEADEALAPQQTDSVVRTSATITPGPA